MALSFLIDSNLLGCDRKVQAEDAVLTWEWMKGGFARVSTWPAGALQGSAMLAICMSKGMLFASTFKSHAVRVAVKGNQLS